jgi:hypothetical protein
MPGILTAQAAQTGARTQEKWQRLTQHDPRQPRVIIQTLTSSSTRARIHDFNPTQALSPCMGKVIKFKIGLAPSACALNTNCEKCHRTSQKNISNNEATDTGQAYTTKEKTRRIRSTWDCEKRVQSKTQYRKRGTTQRNNDSPQLSPFASVSKTNHREKATVPCSFSAPIA